MYLFYVAVKYALHWIVIAFKDSGFIVHVGVSSTWHIIATFEGTPYFCSFLIYLYNTCYEAGLVIDVRHVS